MNANYHSFELISATNFLTLHYFISLFNLLSIAVSAILIMHENLKKILDNHRDQTKLQLQSVHN